jgi:hypothetical protein
MNMLVSLAILAGPSLFFFKGKGEVIVKYVPTIAASQYTVVVAKNDSPWEEASMRRSANWFYHLVAYDSTIRALACYFRSGTIVDDNFGMLYLYEIKTNPRMIMPLSIKQLDVMLKTADAKLLSRATKHDVSEAMTLITYVSELLNLIPDPMRECLFRIEKRRLLDYAASLLTRQ